MNTARIFIVLSLLAPCLMLALSSPAHAGIAAECVPASFSSGQSAAGFNNGSFRPGQTFVSQLSGDLTQVELGLFNGSGVNDVVVEIRSTSAGLPTTNVLASAVITGGPFSDSVLHTATFAPGLLLTTGTTYAITLRTVNPTPNVSALGSFPACATGGTGLYVSSNDSGTTWSSLTDRSFVYRVHVDAGNCNPTAECVPPNFSSGQSAAGFNNGSFRAGQTFTPSTTGMLGEVRLGLFSGGANDVVVEIRSTAAGLPTTTILASAVISGGPFSDSVLHAADFSTSSLTLNSGTTYAITLKTVNASPNVSVLGSFPACATGGTGVYVDSNDAGATWGSRTDRSIVYRVCLESGPTAVETTTWGAVKSLYTD